MPFTRWTKVWIIVTLCSFLAYVFYWLYGALANPYYLTYGDLPENFAPLTVFIATDYVLPVTGNILRFIGIVLALLSAYLVWGPKPKPFSNVKKRTAVALLFEGIYFFSLLPLNILFVVYSGLFTDLLCPRTTTNIEMCPIFTQCTSLHPYQLSKKTTTTTT